MKTEMMIKHRHSYLVRRLRRQRDAVLVERYHPERVRGRRHQILVGDEVLLDGPTLGLCLSLPLVFIYR